MRNPNAKVTDPNKFLTCPGDRMHIEYSVKVKDDGTLSFFESGKTDTQEQINGWYTLTDMSYIVNKLMSGDTSVINANMNPIYGDFTNIPKSPIEMLNFVNHCKEDFDKLPLEIRASFDNDFNKWFSQVDTKEWYEKMNNDSSVVKEDPVTEVTE